MFYYIAQVGQRMGLGSFVHSQYPMAAFIPFVLWLFLNLVLKRLWPRLALHRGELLTIFAMTWVVGTIPQLGWATYWDHLYGPAGLLCLALKISTLRFSLTCFPGTYFPTLHRE